ncbi:MAG: CBS domain-containing protein [Euryarchaeota archaeon]|nr:CBS domain-containing protein [Euryarchaeota archaeon]
MAKLRVGDVRTLITKKATTVSEDAPVSEVARKLIEDPKTHTVYVIDSSERLVGIIPLTEILQYLYYEDIPVEFITYSFPLMYSKDVRARDIMLPPICVKDSDTLTDAFRTMFENKLMELPVVDSDMHVIGDLNGLELIEVRISGQ